MAGEVTIASTGTVLLIPRDARSGNRTGLVAVLERTGEPGAYSIVCFGPERHYRQDGSCRCVAAVLAQMVPEVRERTTLDPFGGKGEEGRIAPREEG